MRVRLTEADINRIVRKLLTEQTQPPLADEFFKVGGNALTTNEFFSNGNYLELIDIGDYYTFIPYGGQERLVLIDKDLIKLNQSDLIKVEDHIDEHIRDLYNNGMVEHSGRGDLDANIKFRDKVFGKYVKFVKGKILNSMASIYRDENNKRNLYIFLDDSTRFIAMISIGDGGEISLHLYHTYREYFNIPKNANNGFLDEMVRNVFSEAFGFSGGIILFGNILRVGLSDWKMLDTGNGKAVLNTIADKI